MNRIRCAIYTRKSSEEGLEQEFNSLHAQREACTAYITSQKHEGWIVLPQSYDDGGISGGTLERPALRRLLADVDEGLVDQIVVYKIDRLTRSLADFAKLVERLDAAKASFVSVTQSFNTATSMGRLTLNVLLSFAQFEREVTAERIRDKIAASKRKGLWMGGNIPLGYEPDGRTLRIVEEEARIIRILYDLYLQHGTILSVTEEARRLQLRSKGRHGPVEEVARSEIGQPYQAQEGATADNISHEIPPSDDDAVRPGVTGCGALLTRGPIHYILTNPVYAGRIRHRSQIHEGQHPSIIDPATWDRVQQKLQEEAARKRGKANSTAASPSFLVGKLFDEEGDRLTPTHAQKQGRRYRYYVSRRLIEKAAKDIMSPNGWRIPGPALEVGIADRIIAHLRQRLALATDQSADAATLHRMQVRLQAAASTPDPDSIQSRLACLSRATIRPGQIDFALDRDGVAALLGLASALLDEAVLTFAAPFQYRKRGKETRLVIGDVQQAVDPILIRNIARANRIYDAIRRGRSIAEAAAGEGFSTRRALQLLDLAFIAPDIVRSIIQGEQPAGLTSAWLEQHPLPSAWQAQRQTIAQL